MALEGDSTPPTEVAVGDNPSPLYNAETPLSPTVPGSDYITDEAELLSRILRTLNQINDKL